MPRATLTALVAELKIVMTDSPWPFFEHTDLLDFPGARSREQMLDLPPEDAKERAHQVRNMLLRGKIAYLFQRYTEERELTCMLLCMPPSVAEVKDLAGWCGSWVEQTHGATPQARAQLSQRAVLRAHQVRHGVPGEGRRDAGVAHRRKWTRRLDASMLRALQQEDWLQNWDGKPFGNTFFLRNPGMKQEHLMDYAEIVKEADGSERWSRPDRAVKRRALIDEYRARFAGSELVHRHFASAGGDLGGGVRRQRRRRELPGRAAGARCSIPSSRRARSASGWSTRRRSWTAACAASTTPTTTPRARRRKQALMNLRRQLFGAVQRAQVPNFAHLVRMLLVRERDVRGAFLNVASLRLIEQPPAPPPRGGRGRSLGGRSVGEPHRPPAAAAPPPRAAGGRPLRAVFATQVLNHWTEARARPRPGRRGRCRRWAWTRMLDDPVADELIIGAHRQALIETHRRAACAPRCSRPTSAGTTSPIAPPASPRRSINDYVSYLGFGDLPEDKRPAVPGAAQAARRAASSRRRRVANGRCRRWAAARWRWSSDLLSGLGRGLAPAGARQHQLRRRPRDRREDNRALGQILETIAIAPLVRQALAGRG